MDRERLRAFIEAAVLTARGPIMPEGILEAISEADIERAEVVATLESLSDEWNRPDRGLRLERVAGGWRCVTPPELDAELRAFHGVQQRQRLSQAALEVLAIIAHRQPVTQPEINFIRGTNSSGVVRTLLDRKLVRVAGRKNVVGKPFLYRTSREFLVHFGLDRIEELPDPEELVKGDIVETADGGEVN